MYGWPSKRNSMSVNQNTAKFHLSLDKQKTEESAVPMFEKLLDKCNHTPRFDTEINLSIARFLIDIPSAEKADLVFIRNYFIGSKNK